MATNREGLSMKVIPDPEITRAIGVVLDDQSDDQLCASFEHVGGGEPWIQVIRDAFNIWWPFEEPVGDRLSGLPLLPEWQQVSDEAEGCVTFEHGTCDVAARVRLVHALFTKLYGMPSDYDVDVEVFALDDGGLPGLIPIRCQERHTPDIGEHADGLFMAFVVASMPQPAPDDWKAHKRWYAVLHRFHADGEHERSDGWFAGTSADGESAVVARAETHLASMLAKLKKVQRKSIAVALFEAEIDGELFGLIDASYDDDFGDVTWCAELVPNELSFGEPWDGSFEA